MYKYILQPGAWGDGSDSEPTLQLLVGRDGGGIQKTAGVRRTHPDVIRFVEGMRKRPGCIYLLVNALGAGEYYGANINADFFSEKDLAPPDVNGRYGHKTFLTAGVYRNHANKDINKSFGKVLLATFNTAMRRVELVIEVDTALAEKFGHHDLVEQLESGVAVPVSMGCRVKFDVCRIRNCGNQSRTRLDYCSHMRDNKGKILEDGQEVCVDNPEPVFFDISFVVVNADRIGYTMHKFAEAGLVGYNLTTEDVLNSLTEDTTLIDDHAKLADMSDRPLSLVKRIPAMSSVLAPALEACTPSLHGDELLRAFRLTSFPLVLRQLLNRGVVVTPREFSAGVLSSGGSHSAARDLLFSSTGPVPTRVSIQITTLRLPEANDSISGLIGGGLSGYISARSLYNEPFSEKASPERLRENLHRGAEGLGAPSGFARKIAEAYGKYRATAAKEISKNVFIDRVGRGHLEDGTKLANAASKDFMVALPLAYLYAAYIKGGNEGESALNGFVREHPILSAAAASGMMRIIRMIGANL